MHKYFWEKDCSFFVVFLAPKSLFALTNTVLHGFQQEFFWVGLLATLPVKHLLCLSVNLSIYLSAYVVQSIFPVLLLWLSEVCLWVMLFTCLSLVYTVKPAKRICFWKLHPAKQAWGQRTYVHLKSVYGVYKSLKLLTDVSFITLHLAFQSVICTLKLWSIKIYPDKIRTTIS